MLKKKKLITSLLIVLVITSLVLIFGIDTLSNLISGSSDPLYDTPENILSQTLEDLENATVFRFSLEAKVLLEDKELSYGTSYGEKNGENIHIAGNLLGAEVDIYQIDDIFYQLDPITNNYHSYESQDLADSTKIIADLNPQKNFQITEITSWEYIGIETLTINEIDQDCLKFIIYPVLDDQWINENFHDICYTIHIDPITQTIYSAHIEGQTTEGMTTATLVMNLTFYDFDADIEIKSPIL